MVNSFHDQDCDGAMPECAPDHYLATVDPPKPPVDFTCTGLRVPTDSTGAPMMGSGSNAPAMICEAGDSACVDNSTSPAPCQASAYCLPFEFCNSDCLQDPTSDACAAVAATAMRLKCTFVGTAMTNASGMAPIQMCGQNVQLPPIGGLQLVAGTWLTGPGPLSPALSQPGSNTNASIASGNGSLSGTLVATGSGQATQTPFTAILFAHLSKTGTPGTISSRGLALPVDITFQTGMCSATDDVAPCQIEQDSSTDPTASATLSACLSSAPPLGDGL
jgi:hypothetical protein